MSNKSPEAFRTISEVSKDLAIPQHVLRFWETKFIQIKPCLLYTSPSPRDRTRPRMPSSA